MPEINWAELDEGRYEKMIAVLLNTIHPGSERIDGRGGDRGRDVQLRSAEGVRLFQQRYVLGRVDSSRRRHIKESLAEAAKHNPLDWSLVIPIDHTEGELKWFDKLRSQYPFPLHWCGLTWLNQQMALRPWIPRFFLWKANDEVVAALHSMREDDKAYRDGSPDALERIRSWATKLNEIDPFHVFDVTSRADGSTAIGVTPRYRGADLDRPIVIAVDAEFPDDEAGSQAAEAFRQSIEAGTPVELPATYIKSVDVREGPEILRGQFKGTSLKISQPGQSDWRLSGSLVVRSVDGQVLAKLPMRYTERTAGSTTATMAGSDVAGALTIRLFVPRDRSPGKMQFHYGESDDLRPAQALPALRFIEHLHAPNRVEVLLDGKRVGEMVPELAEPLVPAGYPRLIAELAEIQEAAADYFPIPETLDNDDLQAIFRTAALLRGEPLEFTWNELILGLGVTHPHELAKAVAANTEASVRLVGPYPVSIAGHTLELQRVVWHFDSARFGNQEDLEARMPFLLGEEIRAVLVPGSVATGRTLPPEGNAPN